jgi:dipeptide/tripeptide permease
VVGGDGVLRDGAARRFLPFAALSASAPLLQGWFAASGHPQASNPYVLYAASNLGSFAALIAYPIVVEPMLSLKDQSYLWSVGFAVLAVLIAAASLLIARRPNISATDSAAAPVSVHDRLTWIGLAAVPTGLVIAVTSYISADIAAAPFLWIVPLALYLLTFVAVFRDRPWISQRGFK